MIAARIKFSFGCVILSSLVLFNNNCVAIPANADSNVNEIADVQPASQAPHSNATTKVFIDGEYNVNVQFNDKIRHIETGEYEMRNGRQVFVVRGVFQYFTDEGKVQIVRPYIFDSHGYHEIDNGIDIRVQDLGPECDLSAGQYCIDEKLLRILVG